MEKWLSKTNSKKEQSENSTKNQVIDIKEEKKKKIRQLLGKPNVNIKKKKNESKIEVSNEDDDFLSYIIEFKTWLNKRSYLKGDIDKIETWIKNLHSKLIIEDFQEADKVIKDIRAKLKIKFKEAPLNLLDEKTRIAINKKLRGTKRTNSDNYYIRKLKKDIEIKLREARHLEVLRQIIELK